MHLHNTVVLFCSVGCWRRLLWPPSPQSSCWTDFTPTPCTNDCLSFSTLSSSVSNIHATTLNMSVILEKGPSVGCFRQGESYQMLQANVTPVVLMSVLICHCQCLYGQSITLFILYGFVRVKYHSMWMIKWTQFKDNDWTLRNSTD